MFAYCNNNPVNYVDSTGTSWLYIAGGLLGGAVAGACISAVSYMVNYSLEKNSMPTGGTDQNTSEEFSDGFWDAVLCGAATGAAGAAIGMISIPSGAYYCGVQITTEALKALGGITLGVCVGTEAGFFSGITTGLFTFWGALIPASGYGFWEDLFTTYAATLFTGASAEALAAGNNYYQSTNCTQNEEHSSKIYPTAPSNENCTVALYK